MKKFSQRGDHETDTTNNPTKFSESKRKKNMKRLGGGGLSLQTFANLKSKDNRYNPSLIKKQKEYYKNAKYISKFRKTLKQQNSHGNNEIGESSNTNKVDDDDDDDDDGDKQKKGNNKSNKRYNLEEVYKKKHEELEKARKEREAMIQAKKEAKEEAEARRKEARGKMLRKTRHGQPVMKYRIEHLLESIKKSAGSA